MNKTLVILGSPRKNGNSAILGNKVIEGITAAGGTYETFYLNGMNIRPCQACDSCKRNNLNTCVIKDDMHLLYPQLPEADSLLITSPIYMFNVSAQLKLFLDRCYAVSQALKGKRVGVVLTYGDSDEYKSGAINAINALKDEFNYAQANLVGIVHGNALAAGEIAANTRLMEQASALGKALHPIL
ncbi:hypothetical protein SRRS_48470 [Sporomusa rhizae]|uniref:flavodoxin family protein n=1 Tax=Sporomusa rhizae TaxID=357999 RepID=UPI00352BA903